MKHCNQNAKNYFTCGNFFKEHLDVLPKECLTQNVANYRCDDRLGLEWWKVGSFQQETNSVSLKRNSADKR